MESTLGGIYFDWTQDVSRRDGRDDASLWKPASLPGLLAAILATPLWALIFNRETKRWVCSKMCSLDSIYSICRTWYKLNIECKNAFGNTAAV